MPICSMPPASVRQDLMESSGSCRCAPATPCACASRCWKHARWRASQPRGCCVHTGISSIRRTSAWLKWKATACSGVVRSKTYRAVLRILQLPQSKFYADIWRGERDYFPKKWREELYPMKDRKELEALFHKHGYTDFKWVEPESPAPAFRSKYPCQEQIDLSGFVANELSAFSVLQEGSI